MKIRVVVRTQTNRIQSRINEAHAVIAIGHRLLIDQSQVAGPHGRSKAGSPILVGRAGGLVRTHVESKIRVRRNVWAIAIGFRTAGAAAGRARLPGRNRIFVRRNAAATVDPSGFRGPWTGRAARSQVRAANGGDINIVRRVNLGRRTPLAAVTGSLKQILTLCRELLEVRVVGVGVRRAPRPRRTQLRIQGTGRSHGIENGSVARSYVHHQARESRSHADGLSHVQSLFGVVASLALQATRAGAVRGLKSNRDMVGLMRVGEVGGQIG